MRFMYCVNTCVTVIIHPLLGARRRRHFIPELLSSTRSYTTQPARFVSIGVELCQPQVVFWSLILAISILISTIFPIFFELRLQKLKKKKEQNEKGESSPLKPCRQCRNWLFCASCSCRNSGKKLYIAPGVWSWPCGARQLGWSPFAVARPFTTIQYKYRQQ